ncbi:uncharacterized protein LOC115631928 [Scaptodrosophila lebanonensis]|uniref:Uncharacterized protein LOC115631928 n=1 Tax=Drosophila lebanonensis TaxID=7225 RepID=A0A6J2U9G2_DROLE|nr:uncharacterized protein LOC115631928 [Scaptodrosophila lebanonensis]
MHPQVPRLLLLLAFLQPLLVSAGYHYDRPTAPTAPASVYTGHKFGPLPTVQPLPPVPALPALPTPRPIPRSRPASAPAAAIANHYLPARPTAVAPPAANVVSHYLPPIASPISQVSYHGVATPNVKPIPASVYGAPGGGYSITQQVNQQLAGSPIVVPSGPSAQAFVASAPSAPSSPSAPSAPALLSSGAALRVPFGKQPLISPGETYVANGRQLKQYAVVEFIDNDIDQSTSPFLHSSFFDEYRAHIGASGTGATPPTGNGLQIDSRANALVLEQQALGVQSRAQQGDAIALGSGGLGYIRLPNGNVYLGSGSLGYISGQQRIASVRDARTRADSTPDAVHFGHGPLGGADNFLRFK